MRHGKNCCNCILLFTGAWLFAFAYCALTSELFEWNQRKTYISPKDFKWPTPAAQLRQSALNRTQARREMSVVKSEIKTEVAPLTIAQDVRANLVGVALIVFLFMVCQERRMQVVRPGIINLKEHKGALSVEV